MGAGMAGRQEQQKEDSWDGLLFFRKRTISQADASGGMPRAKGSGPYWSAPIFYMRAMTDQATP
jgi:hypothetical protein